MTEREPIRSIADLVVALEIMRYKDAPAFAIVTIDEQWSSGEHPLTWAIVNVLGPFIDAPTALAAVHGMLADDAKLLEPGEPGWQHLIVAMFPPEEKP